MKYSEISSIHANTIFNKTTQCISVPMYIFIEYRVITQPANINCHTNSITQPIYTCKNKN